MEKHMQRMWNYKKENTKWMKKWGFYSLGVKDLSQYALFSYMIMALTISKLNWLCDSSKKNIGKLYNPQPVLTACIIRFIVLTFFLA